MTDIFSRYPEFRDKPESMAMLCALLLQRGQHADALAMGMAAVAAAPESSGVRTAVTAALSRSVAEFHVPMLQDDVRNRAYARAIAKAVRPGMRVLEIGTGAGLLAMRAARAGAQVVTCEANPLIAAAAVEIIAANGLSDRISVVAKRSDALRIPEDLPEPADLVIHEIFGAALFDEGVTTALTDARHRLVRAGAPALPPRAGLRCALVRAGRPHRRADLRDVEGFDLSHFELLARYTQSSKAFARHRLEPVSAPHAALAMDYDAPPPFGPALDTITLTSHGGRIDGIAQWIAVDFAQGDALLENDPFGEGATSSWGARYVPLVNPIESAPGDAISVTLRHRGGLLMIDAQAEPQAGSV